MLLSNTPLVVFANPFAAPLDSRGRPAAFVQYDPAYTGGSVRYVGASLDAKVTRKEDSFSARQSRIDKTVVYDMAAQPIVDTMYHRRLIQSGDLIAGNKKTARRAGCKPEAWVEPSKALEAARARAVAAWSAENEGEAPPIESWPDLTIKTEASGAAAEAGGAA